MWEAVRYIFNLCYQLNKYKTWFGKVSHLCWLVFLNGENIKNLKEKSFGWQVELSPEKNSKYLNK
jgi:hypothetical protein